MVTRKNGRAPGADGNERKEKEREKKERRGAAYFLTYAFQPGSLQRCPRDHSDVAGTRREDTGTRLADQIAFDNVAAMTSLVSSSFADLAERKRAIGLTITDDPRESRDETGASRSGRQGGTVSRIHGAILPLLRGAARNADGNGRAKSGHTREIALIDLNVARSAVRRDRRRDASIDRRLTDPERSVARSRCRERLYHQSIVEKPLRKPPTPNT